MITQPDIVRAWRLSPALRTATFDNGAVLLDLRTGRFHLMNQGAAQVLTSLATGGSPLAAAQELDPTRAVDRVSQELTRFLTALHRQGLVIPAYAADGHRGHALAAEAKAPPAAAVATPARRNLAIEDAERARLSSFDKVRGSVAVACAYGLLRCCSLRAIERVVMDQSPVPARGRCARSPERVGRHPPSTAVYIRTDSLPRDVPGCDTVRPKPRPPRGRLVHRRHNAPVYGPRLVEVRKPTPRRAGSVVVSDNPQDLSA